MNEAADKPSGAKAKYEPGSKHALGISRTIYAAGYGLKDGLIWGTVAAVGLFGLLTAGKTYDIPGVKPLADWLVKVHHGMKQKMAGAKWLKWVDAAIVEASVAAWLLVGHVVQIPSTAMGWKKAQDAIDVHDKVLAENQRLVESTTLLKEDNEKLKTNLAMLQSARPPAADRIRAQAAEASTTNSI